MRDASPRHANLDDILERLIEISDKLTEISEKLPNLQHTEIIGENASAPWGGDPYMANSVDAQIRAVKADRIQQPEGGAGEGAARNPALSTYKYRDVLKQSVNI